MISSSWILSFALLVGAGEKPAAVQLCFESDTIALFQDKPGRNYRQLDGNYLLDMDILINGTLTSKRLTRSGQSCIKAWLPAEPVNSIAVDFERTDLNLKPQKRRVRLKLKPDLWFEGGKYRLEQAPFSKASTKLPGKLEFYRIEGAQGSESEYLIENSHHIPAGRYRVRYISPLSSCEITVAVDATGTVREDSNSELYKKLVQSYRDEFAKEIGAKINQKCKEGQTLEIQVSLVDGVFRNPWNPRITKVYDPTHNKRYQLVQNGVAHPFVDGQEIVVGYSQTIRLEKIGKKQ